MHCPSQDVRGAIRSVAESTQSLLAGASEAADKSLGVIIGRAAGAEKQPRPEAFSSRTAN